VIFNFISPHQPHSFFVVFVAGSMIMTNAMGVELPKKQLLGSAAERNRTDTL